jgi:hypothetical protein
MDCREAFEEGLAALRQEDALPPMVVGVSSTRDEAGRLRTVDELDNRMVTELERFGQIADSGRFAAGMTAHGEQQLVLCGGHALGARGLLREAREDSERVTKARQCLVLTV